VDGRHDPLGCSVDVPGVGLADRRSYNVFAVVSTGAASAGVDVLLLGDRAAAPADFRERLLANPWLANPWLANPWLADTPDGRAGRVWWLDLPPYADCLLSHRVLEPMALVHRLIYPETAG
jgi:hypothetical protein